MKMFFVNIVLSGRKLRNMLFMVSPLWNQTLLEPKDVGFTLAKKIISRDIGK